MTPADGMKILWKFKYWLLQNHVIHNLSAEMLPGMDDEWALFGRASVLQIKPCFLLSETFILVRPLQGKHLPITFF